MAGISFQCLSWVELPNYNDKALKLYISVDSDPPPPSRTLLQLPKKKGANDQWPWLSGLTRIRSRGTESETWQANCLFISPRLSAYAQIRGHLREEPSVLTKSRVKKKGKPNPDTKSNPFIPENRKFDQCHGNTSSLWHQSWGQGTKGFVKVIFPWVLSALKSDPCCLFESALVPQYCFTIEQLNFSWYFSPTYFWRLAKTTHCKCAECILMCILMCNEILFWAAGHTGLPVSYRARI